MRRAGVLIGGEDLTPVASSGSGVSIVGDRLEQEGCQLEKERDWNLRKSYLANASKEQGLDIVRKEFESLGNGTRVSSVVGSSLEKVY